MLPAARIRNARFAPETGGPVEIKETPAPAARDLLEEQMAIEKHRLHAGEERIAAVDVPPTRLNHPHFRIGEKMDGGFEQLGLRNKIGVEDADKLAARGGQPGLERPGFVADAVGAVDQLDVEAARGQSPDA